MKKKIKKIKTNVVLTPFDEPKSNICPRCKSHYAGKIPVLDFKDPEYTTGKKEKPPTIMVTCHGVHPTDPWIGKD
jgi:hypothetical protein